MRVVTAFMTATLFFLGPAQADSPAYVVGNELHDWCTTDLKAAGGYIIGVFDGMSTSADFTGDPGLKQCSPLQISRGQLIDVACRSLENHPEKRHLTASSLIWTAIHEAWPCS